MKKTLFYFFIIFFASVSIAFADWLVSASWTKSPGPYLIEEELLLDGEAMCSITDGADTKCEFILEQLKNQKILIRSYNVQGAYTDFDGGSIFDPPGSASGFSVIIKWQP